MMDSKNSAILPIFVLVLQCVVALPVDLLQSNSCGGVMEGPAGVINYKFGENYTKYEACVWTIFAPEFSFISFRLLNDGLHKSDEIQIFETDWYTDMDSRILLSHRIDAGDRNETNIKGPLIYVVFGPYASGTGFSLLFEGKGKEDLTENYVLHHVEEDSVVGNFTYDKAVNSIGTRDIFSCVISASDRSVITTLSVSNYVTEYELGSTGIWTNNLSIHEFQPGSPPNIYQLLGLHHSDDSVKTFKVNRPVVIYGHVRNEAPGHLDITWSKSQNGTVKMNV